MDKLFFYILEHGGEFITDFDTMQEALDYRKEFLTPEWGVKRVYTREYLDKLGVGIC